MSAFHSYTADLLRSCLESVRLEKQTASADRWNILVDLEKRANKAIEELRRDGPNDRQDNAAPQGQASSRSQSEVVAAREIVAASPAGAAPFGGEQSGDVRKSETPQGVVGTQMPRDGSIPSALGRDPVWQALVDLTLAVGNHHDAMVSTGDLHTPFARAAEALLKYGPRRGVE